MSPPDPGDATSSIDGDLVERVVARHHAETFVEHLLFGLALGGIGALPFLFGALALLVLLCGPPFSLDHVSAAISTWWAQ